MSKRSVTIWLVRDTCRVEDNPSLNLALETAGQSGTACFALACLEPRRWEHYQFGLARTGSAWKSFRANALIQLRTELLQHDISLWIGAGDPSALVGQIREQFTISAIITDLPLATEETEENRRLQNLGVKVLTTQSDELFEATNIHSALERLPCSFTQFRKTIEKDGSIVPTLPVKFSALGSPVAQIWLDPPELHEARNFDKHRYAQPGWQQYLESGALSTYKKTRNALEGANMSSRLSAWLAHGCLSVRRAWHDTLEYEENYGANESTYWLRFELLWREFFRWYSRHIGSALFTKTSKNDVCKVNQSESVLFGNWCSGNTGVDIIDAAMRELKQTGWLSNRGRQLVASHLIYEYGLDWRLGAAWFESQLVDFDVASNWGNWAYIAGVGADPRGGRIFDLESQAERYDPKKTYRDRWLGLSPQKSEH